MSVFLTIFEHLGCGDRQRRDSVRMMVIKQGGNYRFIQLG